MKTHYYPAESRGTANYGWLKTKYSFSFSNYYNPQRMNFGALRVLNDDWIAPQSGFDTHPHDNMEIVTILLEGELTHRDSMGNTETIRAGEVQVMSAGTGIMHSEHNLHPQQATSLFQLWIYPDARNHLPRYDQKNYESQLVDNQLNVVVSPQSVSNNGLWIHQDAWLSIGLFSGGEQHSYAFHTPQNGVFVFVVEGALEIANQHLSKRDALGVWDCSNFSFKAIDKNTKLLFVEVPMTF